MPSARLPDRVGQIVVCPVCRGDLACGDGHLACACCGEVFRMEGGVPVFISGPVEIAREHTSNPIGPQFEALLQSGHDFILNIGAGGTAQRFPNCVEFEHKLFRHTDVVGDAHALPFRDETFDRVFAFNVFEHLREPKTAAGEIRRVLKPGGTTIIHTAFLQALHEAPHHYFNATEYGVREWFADFRIESCEVSGNFGPGIMLSYLAANIWQACGEADVATEQIPLREWAEFWNRHCAGPLPDGFLALQNLPQPLQKRIAGGFQLIARKSATGTESPSRDRVR